MKCFVCKKEFDGGFQDASGNKYCSRECLNYKDSFNYGIKVIIDHRLNCMNYLPISNIMMPLPLAKKRVLLVKGILH